MEKMENRAAPVAVREKRPGDDPALAALYQSVREREFPWTDRNTISESDFYGDTEGEAILVAELAGEIAGFVSVWEPDRFIHHLYIGAGVRGRGAGSALIAEAARRWGYPLALKCMKENRAALSFYLRGGWVIAREERGAEGPYYLMKLWTPLKTRHDALWTV